LAMPGCGLIAISDVLFVSSRSASPYFNLKLCSMTSSTLNRKALLKKLENLQDLLASRHLCYLTSCGWTFFATEPSEFQRSFGTIVSYPGEYELAAQPSVKKLTLGDSARTKFHKHVFQSAL
jgi:hypothetical protein